MLIIRNLVKRLRDADRKIESLALIDVYGRVARLLIDMAEEIDGQWVVPRAPPKQEIARMIGASREMVSRVVKGLQDKGLIRAEKRRIVVLDRQSMSRTHTAHWPLRRAERDPSHSRKRPFRAVNFRRALQFLSIYNQKLKVDDFN